MELYGSSVMQAHQRDPVSGSWYISQAKADSPLETTYLTHCEYRGAAYSHMILDQGGHGGSIGLEHTDGEPVQITTHWGGSGDDLVTFNYQYGTTLQRSDNGFTVLAKFGHNTVTPSFDQPHDYCVYRYTHNGHSLFERRKLSEVKAGIDRTYGPTIGGSAATDGSGGFTAVGDEFFFAPTTSDANEIKIEKYSWLTGEYTGTHSLAGLSEQADGSVYGDYAEPECLSVHLDADTGRIVLYIGVVNGQKGDRRNKLFGLF